MLVHIFVDQSTEITSIVRNKNTSNGPHVITSPRAENLRFVLLHIHTRRPVARPLHTKTTWEYWSKPKAGGDRPLACHPLLHRGRVGVQQRVVGPRESCCCCCCCWRSGPVPGTRCVLPGKDAHVRFKFNVKRGLKFSFREFAHTAGVCTVKVVVQRGRVALQFSGKIQGN